MSARCENCPICITEITKVEPCIMENSPTPILEEAVRFSLDREGYCSNLANWVHQSWNNIGTNNHELPANLTAFEEVAHSYLEEHKLLTHIEPIMSAIKRRVKLPRILDKESATIWNRYLTLKVNNNVQLTSRTKIDDFKGAIGYLYELYADQLEDA